MLIQKTFTAVPMVASVTITLPSWAGGLVGVVLVILLIAALILVFKKEYWGALVMIAVMALIIILFNDGIDMGPLSNAFSNKGIEVLSELW